MNPQILELSSHFSVDLSDIEAAYPVPIGVLCDKLGIVVIFDKEMADECSGKVAFDPEKQKYVITLNDNKNYYHNIFTTAHEIGHCLMHSAIVKSKGFMERKPTGEYDPEDISMEREANNFAANLLMPEPKFAEVFYQSGGKLDAVQRFFQVSLEAVTYRANNLGLIMHF